MKAQVIISLALAACALVSVASADDEKCRDLFKDELSTNLPAGNLVELSDRIKIEDGTQCDFYCKMYYAGDLYDPIARFSDKRCCCGAIPKVRSTDEKCRELVMKDSSASFSEKNPMPEVIVDLADRITIKDNEQCEFYCKMFYADKSTEVFAQKYGDRCCCGPRSKTN